MNPESSQKVPKTDEKEFVEGGDEDKQLINISREDVKAANPQGNISGLDEFNETVEADGDPQGGSADKIGRKSGSLGVPVDEAKETILKKSSVSERYNEALEDEFEEEEAVEVKGDDQEPQKPVDGEEESENDKKDDGGGEVEEGREGDNANVVHGEEGSEDGESAAGVEEGDDPDDRSKEGVIMEQEEDDEQVLIEEDEEPEKIDPEEEPAQDQEKEEDFEEEKAEIENPVSEEEDMKLESKGEEEGGDGQGSRLVPSDEEIQKPEDEGKEGVLEEGSNDLVSEKNSEPFDGEKSREEASEKEDQPDPAPQGEDPNQKEDFPDEQKNTEEPQKDQLEESKDAENDPQPSSNLNEHSEPPSDLNIEPKQETILKGEEDLSMPPVDIQPPNEILIDNQIDEKNQPEVENDNIGENTEIKPDMEDEAEQEDADEFIVEDKDQDIQETPKNFSNLGATLAKKSLLKINEEEIEESRDMSRAISRRGEHSGIVEIPQTDPNPTNPIQDQKDPKSDQIELKTVPKRSSTPPKKLNPQKRLKKIPRNKRFQTNSQKPTTQPKGHQNRSPNLHRPKPLIYPSYLKKAQNRSRSPQRGPEKSKSPTKIPKKSKKHEKSKNQPKVNSFIFKATEKNPHPRIISSPQNASKTRTGVGYLAQTGSKLNKRKMILNKKSKKTKGMFDELHITIDRNHQCKPLKRLRTIKLSKQRYKTKKGKSQLRLLKIKTQPKFYYNKSSSYEPNYRKTAKARLKRIREWSQAKTSHINDMSDLIGPNGIYSMNRTTEHIRDIKEAAEEDETSRAAPRSNYKLRTWKSQFDEEYSLDSVTRLLPDTNSERTIKTNFKDDPLSKTSHFANKRHQKTVKRRLFNKLRVNLPKINPDLAETLINGRVLSDEERIEKMGIHMPTRLEHCSYLMTDFRNSYFNPSKSKMSKKLKKHFRRIYEVLVAKEEYEPAVEKDVEDKMVFIRNEYGGVQNLLVLDLDETLVHSEVSMTRNKKAGHRIRVENDFGEIQEVRFPIILKKFDF